MFSFLMPGCEKAKEAVGKLREEAGGLVDQAKSGGVDEALAAQVSRDQAGVRFRRDLPFPDKLSVETTESWTYVNGRGMSRSDLGGGGAFSMEGTFERVARFRKSGGEVVMTLDRTGPVVDKEKEGKDAPPPPKEENPDPESRLVGKSLTLHHTRQGWKVPKGQGAVDFQMMAWGRSVEPRAADLFLSAGLFPRSQWFPASRVWKEGDDVELSGPSLALVTEQGASGKVRLIFEAEEAVAGHPCGRFSVEGNLSAKDVPGVDGKTTSMEMTISTGKVWCSLLHPVILKEDLDVVVTMNSEGAGGAKNRYQGGLRTVETKVWKAE